MSDTCPNCGSACPNCDDDSRFAALEELSTARDAERDQIANWLRTCNPSKTAPHLAGCFGSADKLADAIRNNEHRKDGQ